MQRGSQSLWNRVGAPSVLSSEPRFQAVFDGAYQLSRGREERLPDSAQVAFGDRLKPELRTRDSELGALIWLRFCRSGAEGQSSGGFASGSFAIRHTSFVIRHTSYVIRHSPFAIRHSPFSPDRETFGLAFGHTATPLLTQPTPPTSLGPQLSGALCSEANVHPPICGNAPRQLTDCAKCFEWTCDLFAGTPLCDPFES